MNARIAALAAASLLLAAPAATLAESSSSASLSSSSVTSREAAKIEQCKRFARGDDYERCVKLIRRLPVRGSSSSASSSSSRVPLDESDKEWKWVNIQNRLEEKLKSTVKFVSVMAKQFCKERTDENETTSRECMARLRDHLKTKMSDVIDEVFRADLPSAR